MSNTFDNEYICQVCGGENELTTIDYVEHYPSEYETECKDCGFKSFWAYGFYLPLGGKIRDYALDNFKYVKPSGLHLRVSSREWNILFRDKAVSPTTVTNIYIRNNMAIVHHYINPLLKAIYSLFAPVHYLGMFMVVGHRKASDEVLNKLCDKSRGAFTVDTIQKLDSSGNMTSDWVKLLALVEG